MEAALQHNFNIEDDKVLVLTEYHSGGTLQGELERLLHRLTRAQNNDTTLPDTVMFHMGTNDLCRGRVTETLLNWRQATLAVVDKFPSVRLVLCSVLPRRKHHHRMDVPLHVFEENRLAANRFMANIMVDNVHFWDHSHRSFRRLSMYANDGVHMSAAGKRVLARSIRGAVLANAWK